MQHIQFIDAKLNVIYTNKTLENTTFSVPISSLFVSATVLSLDEDKSTIIDPMHKYTVMYNLRMGEHVGSERVSNVLKTVFSGGSLWIHNLQNLDMTFTSYYIFKDSDNILCDLTSNGNCDPVSTDCRQQNGTTFCKCKDGYQKLNPSEKFCIDIDECITNTCKNETCVNLPGNWTCKCKVSSSVPVQYDRNNFTCKEVNVSQCGIHKDFQCDGGSSSCINDIWQCICPKGYHSVSINGTLMTCTGVNTKGHMQLEDVIHVSCSGSQWDISVGMDQLQLLYPGIRPQEIFFGQPNCQGTLENVMLRFKQSLHMCMTTEKTSDKIVIYNNKLFYAILDPINPFLIRQHVWTFAVECDVMRGGLGSSHLHHNIETHKATAVEQYNVSVELFSDHNFMQPVTSSKHNVGVGDDVYVKVSTTLTDWNIKMRLHTCYTKPFYNATQDKAVMLISDGCEVESNTHIISQSTHETKFVFQDFEYVTNDEGLYIYCNATFCDSKDYSAACVQSCRQTPTFVG